jgi:N-acetyl-1-D-myo-inositol-2-amino-2-deoxy-alpha-D-glucopyranoside deacetylase
MTQRLVLLGIFPHPDDEAYAAGGAMAKAAASGADVYVLCATRGEAGEVRDERANTGRQASSSAHAGAGTQEEGTTTVPPLLAGPSAGSAGGPPQTSKGARGRGPLAAVREQELRAACAALGIHPPRFLDYQDGTLDSVDLPEAVGRIVRVIRELRPRVVITMGPDGVYGHPDHVALHKLVMPAFRSAAGGSRFPEEEFGPPHEPERLFWVAYPRGHFRPVWERLLSTGLADGVRQVDPERLGVSDEEVHAVVDVAEFVPAKLAALRAHRTQISGDDPLSIFPAGILEPLLATERFTLAIGDRPPVRLTDLFEGLT